MTNYHNIGSAGVSWVAFGAECLAVVTDLRWMILLTIILIAGDFWWGWRECVLHKEEAKTEEEKAKYKFRFSLAGRRTLNKLVDYTSYLLVGAVFGLAITEPIGVCGHTFTAAIGLGFGCLFEISSIVGHIAQVKGFKVKIDYKRLLVAIVRQKSEGMAEILDEGIEHIDNGEREHHMKHPHHAPPVPMMNEEDEGIKDEDFSTGC